MRTPRSSAHTLILTLIAMALVALLAAWQIGQHYRQELADSLQLTLTTSQQALLRWRRIELLHLQSWAGNEQLSELTETLLQTTEPIRRAQLRQQIHQLLAPVTQNHFSSGYLIIDRQQRVIASSSAQLNQQARRLMRQFSQRDALWHQQARLSPFFSESVEGYSAAGPTQRPTQYAVTAIKPRAAPESQALLAIKLNLSESFYPILTQARMGGTGETYLLDRKGVMLSPSRFNQQLIDYHLLSPGQTAALNLTVRDPGHDLRTHPLSNVDQRPLTHMAQSLVRGLSGIATHPYRDYRGIPVVGSWLWDNELQLGIATEIEANQAYKGLNITYGWLVFISLATMLLISVLFFRIRHQQQHLIRANTEISSILDNAPAFILVRDLQNQVLYANHETRQLFGAPQQTAPLIIAAGQNAFSHPPLDEIILSRFKQFIEQNDQLILKNRTGLSFTSDIQLKQDSRHFLLTKFPLKDSHGEIYAIGLSGVDITERLNIERQLKEKEQFQANLMANLPGAVFRCELDYNGWNLTYISPGCLELLGHTAQELTKDNGTLFTELIHPEDRDKVLEKLRFSAQNNLPYAIEYRLNNPQQTVWLWARGRIIEHEEIRHTEGFLSDITERKLAEKELAEHRKQLTKVVAERTKDLDRERERLADIIRSAADGIISLDDNYIISLFSPSAQRILHVQKHNPTGQSVFTLFAPSEHNILRQHLRKLDRNHNITPALELAIASDNSIKAEVTISQNAAHGKVNYTLIVRDISLRKEQQKALELAISKAQEASLAKSQFLANISHEIRTPLNAIIGMSQLALNTPLTQKQLRYMKTIEYSSHTLLGVINDVLDFSKIEAGKLQIESIPFNLESTLEAISQMTALRAQEKGVDFLLDIDPEVPCHLIGDPLRLSQVLTNLCSNATKFTEHGHITLGCKLLNSSEQEVELEFFVQDTGIGLSPEQQQQLFKAFSQADPSVTRRYGGTGLGLSICRELIGLMKGEIRIQSEPDKGSCFSFNLTLKRDLTQQPCNQQGFRKNLDILLVEDNKSTAKMLINALQTMGHKVQHCEGGEQALAILSDQQPFDAMLVDWQLPGISGDALISQVKAEANSHPPIVVMITAFEESEAAPVARDAGADALLIKPISSSTLYDTLDNLSHPLTQKPFTSRAPITPFKVPESVQNARLLLAEDNEINREIAREIFENAGFKVLCVRNGQEAIDWFLDQGADLILMDIQMPVLDGESATRKIRATEKGKTIPIIAMTANALNEDRQRCLSAGMNDYLTKPIDIEKAITCVCRWLDAEITEPHDNSSTPNEPAPTGLDTHRGLINCSGNKELYLKLLREFAQNYSDYPAQIGLLLDQQNFAEAHKKTHALKGVSGNLGANLLYQATKNLDDNIRQNQPDTKQLSAQVFSFNRAFKQTLSHIRELADDSYF